MMNTNQFIAELKRFCNEKNIKFGFSQDEAPAFTQIHTMTVLHTGIGFDSHLTVTDFFDANKFLKDTDSSVLHGDKDFHKNYSMNLSMTHYEKKTMPENFDYLIGAKHKPTFKHNEYYVRTEYYGSLGGDLNNSGRLGFLSLVDLLKVQNYIHLNPEIFKDFMKNVFENDYFSDEFDEKKKFDYEEFTAPKITYQQAKNIEQQMKELVLKVENYSTGRDFYSEFVKKEKALNQEWNDLKPFVEEE